GGIAGCLPAGLVHRIAAGALDRGPPGRRDASVPARPAAAGLVVCAGVLRTVAGFRRTLSGFSAGPVPAALCRLLRGRWLVRSVQAGDAAAGAAFPGRVVAAAGGDRGGAGGRAQSGRLAMAGTESAAGAAGAARLARRAHPPAVAASVGCRSARPARLSRRNTTAAQKPRVRRPTRPAHGAGTAAPAARRAAPPRRRCCAGSPAPRRFGYGTTKEHERCRTARSHSIRSARSAAPPRPARLPATTATAAPTATMTSSSRLPRDGFPADVRRQTNL